uniref:Secreted protein n=1 Tax=Arundo donax TaxID=35708 RepID=A0A0A9FW77_ARUDO
MLTAQLELVLMMLLPRKPTGAAMAPNQIQESNHCVFAGASSCFTQGSDWCVSFGSMDALDYIHY